MSHGALTHGNLVEISLTNLREHPADAARWLAVEVLLSERPSETTTWWTACATSRTA
jgi:hypothetical protein